MIQFRTNRYISQAYVFGKPFTDLPLRIEVGKRPFHPRCQTLIAGLTVLLSRDF